MILYGKSSKAIAEDLNITQEKADEIFNTFFKRFPSVKAFMENTQQLAKDKGYVKTIWGRKRHLPEMQLDVIEVKAGDGYAEDFNPFLFKDQKNTLSSKVKNKWLKTYNNAKGRSQKQDVITSALKDHIIIKDNFKIINDTTRQCVNSVIQGSAGEMIKLIMIEVSKDKILNDLDFHLLLTIHDEIIGEAPEKYAKEVYNRLKELMLNVPTRTLKVPMKVDLTISKVWTGEELKI